jgi:dolichol-phosphate mannosyltransferase
MSKTISIITAVYNESENVFDLCKVLDEYAAGKPFSLELIFVDDGSRDNTLELLRSYRFVNTAAKIVKLSRNFGSHAAVRAGLSVAGGEYTALFSGDLQEPVGMIGDLYDKIETGYDIVYVEKGETRVSFSERAFSRAYARLMRRYVFNEFPYGGVNNFMITSKIRTLMVENAELNSSIFLQIMDMGFNYTFIKYDYLERTKGKSKWTFGKKIKALIDSFLAFSFAPIRAVSLLGILLSIAGVIYALFIIIVRIFNVFPLDTGFPTLISVILIGFGLTNISLGIIAEYLWRTLDASRGRPAFIIDDIIDA